jgi:hypothetical protein
MWVFLSGSFLSIVDKDDNSGLSVLVRARKKGDIERVFPAATVIEGAGSDYQYRARIEREEVALRMANEVRSIKYPNFKSTVKERDRHDAYMHVWESMYRYQLKR